VLCGNRGAAIAAGQIAARNTIIERGTFICLP
jgi:hypothetical protein